MKNRIICFISALALMSVMFCINVFATVPYNSSDDVKTVINTAFEEKGLNRDDYYCFVYAVDSENDNMPYRISYYVCYFNKQEFDYKECTISLADLTSNSSASVMCFKPDKITDFGSINVTQLVKDKSFSLGANTNLSVHSSKHNAYRLQFFYWDETQILYTDIPIYKGVYDSTNGLTDDGLSNGVAWSPTNEAPIPFTVTYTPELSTDMTPSTITYPSKSGSTVTDYTYDIKVNVQLTEDFINKSASWDFNYTYQFVCFIVPCETLYGGLSDDALTVANSSIYTAVTQGDYAYSDWTTDNVDTSSPLYHAVANGLTNIFVIGLDKPRNVEFVIDMRNVDFNGNPSDCGYKIIVWGSLINLNESGVEGVSPRVASPRAFKSTNEHLSFSSVAPFPTSQKIDDNVGGEVIEDLTPENTVNLYQYYADFSDQFNYASDLIPPYEKLVKTDKDGNPIDIGTNPLDFNHTAFTVTDNSYGSGDTGGSHEPMSPNDFDEYVKNWELENNLSTDFNFNSVEQLLNGTSQYFAFLTAGISILPSWFLTALMAFFGTVLTICTVGLAAKLILSIAGSIKDTITGG